MKLNLLLAAAMAIMPAQSGRLSPDFWSPQDQARIERLSASPFPPQTRLVSARSELVSATLSPAAAHAGMEALRRGGTAADAAVATALTQVATDLGAVVSYAGVAELLYYDAQSGSVSVMDAGWNAYAGETSPQTIPSIDLAAMGVQSPPPTSAEQGRKTLVPGFMAGMEAIHSRFGKLPFAVLFQPAIWYAENGVQVDRLHAGYFKGQARYLARTAAGRAFLSQAGRELPLAGDRFIQPDLARTLRAVAAGGAQVMYGGDWGRAYVAAVRAEGGKATIEDMQAYRPLWTAPLRTQFAGAVVYGPDAANSSACQILEALNLLQHQPDATAPYSRDAASFRAYAQTLRFALYAHHDPAVGAAERSAGLGSDCAARLSPQYGRAIAPMIAKLIDRPMVQSAGSHSASVVVVDRFGNVAALVHSINAVTWGDTGIVVGGFRCPTLPVCTKPGWARWAKIVAWGPTLRR